jgi:hypothetical protein
MDESGRLPGVMPLAGPWMRPKRFGAPSFVVKSSISLFIRKPAPGMVTQEPKAPLMV